MSESQLRQALRASKFDVKQYPEIRQHEVTVGTRTQIQLTAHWTSKVPVGLLASLLTRLPDGAWIDAHYGGGPNEAGGIELTWRIG